MAFGFWLLAFGFWLLAFGFWLFIKYRPLTRQSRLTADRRPLTAESLMVTTFK